MAGPTKPPEAPPCPICPAGRLLERHDLLDGLRLVCDRCGHSRPAAQKLAGGGPGDDAAEGEAD